MVLYKNNVADEQDSHDYDMQTPNTFQVRYMHLTNKHKLQIIYMYLYKYIAAVRKVRKNLKELQHQSVDNQVDLSMPAEGGVVAEDMGWTRKETRTRKYMWTR